MSADADSIRRPEVHRAARELADQHAVIEQAKGMLMFVYGIDADGAFHVLRSQSQQHNVKLRLVAERIVADFVEFARDKPLRDRADHDRLLLTAHQRITRGPDA